MRVTTARPHSCTSLFLPYPSYLVIGSVHAGLVLTICTIKSRCCVMTRPWSQTVKLSNKIMLIASHRLISLRPFLGFGVVGVGTYLYACICFHTGQSGKCRLSSRYCCSYISPASQVHVAIFLLGSSVRQINQFALSCRLVKPNVVCTDVVNDDARVRPDQPC